MKQEKLFEALCNIGDDLILMAQTKRYVNHWRRWGRTAACLALVLCLTVLALPYFPMGCGSKEEAPAEAPAETPAEAPAERPPETPAETPAEAPAEEESSEEQVTGMVICYWKEPAQELMLTEPDAKALWTWFNSHEAEQEGPCECVCVYEFRFGADRFQLSDTLDHVNAVVDDRVYGFDLTAEETQFLKGYLRAYLLPVQEEEPVLEQNEPMDIIVHNHTYYYRQRWYQPHETCDLPVVGTVMESNDPALVGRTICEAYYTVHWTAHAVEGLTVPAEILVETPDGYVLFRTANEKTVARFSYEEVEAAIRNNDDAFLLENFIDSFESRPNQIPEFSDPSELSASELEDVFIASWSLNTGLPVETYWAGDSDEVVLAPENVQWRLNRFLDAVSYDATQSMRYDPAENSVQFSIDSICADKVDTSNVELIDAQIVGDHTVALTVHSAVDRCYVIRFDSDSWRYLSITTIS